MLKKIGGLWLKDGKKGKFMSGEIETGDTKLHVMVFKNEKDGVEKRPDYLVMKAVDDEEPTQPDYISKDDESPF